MASHYIPEQRHSGLPCQGPSQQVAFSLAGSPPTAPTGAARGPPTSWRALLDALLSGRFPVLLICGCQGAEPFGHASIVEETFRFF